MIIYCTVNLINGKKYVGRDANNNPSYYGSGYYFLKAIKKYGKENFQKFVLEILPLNADKHLLRIREFWWLKHLNCKFESKYYNVSENNGGLGKGDKLTEECKKRISINTSNSMKDINFTKKWRDIISKTNIGRIPWNKGKSSPIINRKQNKTFITSEISEILNLYELGNSASTLSKQFNCSHHTILKIVRSNGKYPVL